MIRQAAITRMKLADIRPAPYNPRIDLQPGDPQYEALRKSLERWGLVETIVVNRRSGHLVGGHQRLKILLQAGVPEADVSLVDLGPDDEKALNIALNSPALAGEYDDGKLAGVLQELQAGGYEIGLTGFDAAALDDILSKLGQGELQGPQSDSEPDLDGNRCTCPKCGFTWQPRPKGDTDWPD